MADRKTEWLWVSFTGHTKNSSRVGVNLSKFVYDDANGVSQENVIWLDGKMHLLSKGAVDIICPSNDKVLEENWMIISRSKPTRESTALTYPFVSLVFSPKGTREEHLDFSLIVSDFTQPFGVFSGSILFADGSQVEVENVLGVVERHLSVW